MINGKKLFDQAIKNDLKTYDNIRKIKLVLEIITQLVVCQITIIYNYKQAPDVDPKAIQQINFTGNLTCNDNRVMLFITEESKETILQDCFHFSEETVKLL